VKPTIPTYGFASRFIIYIIFKIFFSEKCIYLQFFFQNMHLFIKIPKYAKVCKIKFNVSDSMSYKTNLLLGLQFVRLKEKICKSHKHPNPNHDL